MFRPYRSSCGATTDAWTARSSWVWCRSGWRIWTWKTWTSAGTNCSLPHPCATLPSPPNRWAARPPRNPRCPRGLRGLTPWSTKCAWPRQDHRRAPRAHLRIWMEWTKTETTFERFGSRVRPRRSGNCWWSESRSDAVVLSGEDSLHQRINGELEAQPRSARGARLSRVAWSVSEALFRRAPFI